ncbi:MAG: RDD family protein [Actinomycetes bacterium]
MTATADGRRADQPDPAERPVQPDEDVGAADGHARSSGWSSALSSVPREARPYQGRRAGVVSRLLASAVDGLVAVAMTAAVYGLYVGVEFLRHPARFTPPHLSSSALAVVAGALLTVYLAQSWATTGRSYGGHLLGLRVLDRHGHRLGAGLALVRALFCVLLPIGLLWSVVSRANRSVQDVVLRTSVVYDWTERSALPRPRTSPDELRDDLT